MNLYCFKRIFTLVVLLIGAFLQTVVAQQGFGTANPDQNAVVDLSSTNKGLLLPRLTLTSTTSFSPLTAHVAGMVVYNTATSNPAVITTFNERVTPGFYFNNGVKWIRVLSMNDKAWYEASTLSGANNNTQNIYQMGNVGIGTSTPLSALHIKETATTGASANPLILQSIQDQVFDDSLKLLIINTATGVVNYSTKPTPKSFTLVATSGTQNFTTTAFGSTSSPTNADQLTLSSSDILISSNFATLNNDIITITETGDYDLTSYCNLLMPAITTGPSNYSSGATEAFMNVSFDIQTRSGAGSWTTIASSTNTINSLSFNLTFTLKPAITGHHFTANDEVRLIIYRGGGIHLISGTPTTGSLGSGIIQNKLLRISRYN